MSRAKRGDRKAFAELYEVFAGPLYSRVLMPRLGDAQAAEDALAETFRTALERLDRFEYQRKSIWFWLSRVAVNKATDMHRVKQRTSRALTNFEGMLKPLRDNPSGPSETIGRRDEFHRVKRAVGEVMKTINPRYRRAIELRFFEEKSRQDCADEMEVKVGTFDVVLLRSLRAFRREWEAMFKDPLQEAKA